jgi:hypothetical protein
VGDCGVGEVGDIELVEIINFVLLLTGLHVAYQKLNINDKLLVLN